MKRVIDQWGIPDNAGSTAADFDVPDGLTHPVWTGAQWVSNAHRYLEKSLYKPTPTQVTMRQARLALLGAGLLDAVEAAILAAGPAAKIEWEYAQEVQRASGLVPAMATALGMTDAQINDLFLTASTF